MRSAFEAGRIDILPVEDGAGEGRLARPGEGWDRWCGSHKDFWFSTANLPGSGED